MKTIFTEDIDKIALKSKYDKIIEWNGFSRSICIYNKLKIKGKTVKN